MKNDVMISIRSVQDAGGEPDVVEFVTDGRMYTRNGCYYISYKESELTGMAGTTTLLKLDETPALTLTRTGTVSSELVFRKNVRNFSAMRMAEGSLTIGVHTHDLQSDLRPEGGSIHLGYTVEYDSEVAATHSLEVSVREKTRGAEYEIPECE
ncbi:MAG: DUF1934 domain-containing protein [Clostridia bacterium]|nr:DUF1934 domain-containing protein [Clostridia bacterium]